MARYKPWTTAQLIMLPVDFREQILPGSFEYTLNEFIDRDVDLSVFEARYRNDEVGAPAYDPAILLKVILYAYSKGITSSRAIARLCATHVIFVALCAGSQPHFTTIAEFVSTTSEEIEAVFRDALLVCDELGLIGRDMFAIDGVKLPSNASKEWSGTREDFARKVAKMGKAVRYLVRRHRETDAKREDPAQSAARSKQIARLRAAVKKVRTFAATHPERLGAKGSVRKSNITDNESAKMATGKGVIQGYAGVAVVDAKHQVVVRANAFGEAQEHGLLVPMLEATRQTFRDTLKDRDVLKHAMIVADAGYHSEANVGYLYQHGIDGYLADTLFRKRDPRFATAVRHLPTSAWAPHARPTGLKLFRPADFRVAPDLSHAICPAGKRLYRNGRHCKIGNFEAVKFTGAQRDCGACTLRAQCLRHPDRTKVRQVAMFQGRATGKPETWTARMKRKIDTEEGRYRYSRRLGIVEPVFANITVAKGLRRFTLRGRRKVDAQWKLFCLVHNIGKIGRHGDGERRRGGRWQKQARQ